MPCTSVAVLCRCLLTNYALLRKQCNALPCPATIFPGAVFPPSSFPPTVLRLATDCTARLWSPSLVPLSFKSLYQRLPDLLPHLNVLTSEPLPCCPPRPSALLPLLFAVCPAAAHLAWHAHLRSRVDPLGRCLLLPWPHYLLAPPPPLRTLTCFARVLPAACTFQYVFLAKGAPCGSAGRCIHAPRRPPSCSD